MSDTFGFYHKENFLLQTFMDEELDHLRRVWEIKELQIKGLKLEEGEHCKATIVSKNPNEPYVLSLRIRKNERVYYKRVEEFISLDKLKEKHPFLFQIKGTFNAIPDL